jgi:FecR protein
MKKIFAALLLSLAQSVWAVPAAVVDAVQFPAFLDRNGLSVPLTIGTELQTNDQLRTGSGGRLLLKLPEGSVVKLGEKATFQIAKHKGEGGIFTATMNVLEGAFRFTTDVFSKRKPRNVQFGIAKNITIGIRGTDLWGRGRGDKDIVCLIEGKIEVKGNDDKAVTLDQPLQFFQSTRTAPPLPVSTLDPKQLAEWALETELVKGKGATSAGGTWRVVLSGFAGRDEARNANRQLRASGYPSEVGSLNTLQITGLGDEAGAKALAESLKGKYGIKEAAAMQ